MPGHRPNPAMGTRNPSEPLALDHRPSAAACKEPTSLHHVGDRLPSETRLEGVVEVARPSAREIDEVGGRDPIGERRIVGACTIPHSNRFGLDTQGSEVVDAAVHPIVDLVLAFSSCGGGEADHARRVIEQLDELPIHRSHRREVFAASYDSEHDHLAVTAPPRGCARERRTRRGGRRRPWPGRTRPSRRGTLRRLGTHRGAAT